MKLLSSLFVLHFLALALALLASAGALADTIIPGGYVSGIWTAAGSPYLIFGNLTIAADSSLEIQAGVSVIFQDCYYLRCEGQLLANGTVSDTIHFTAQNPSAGWDGIDFVDLNSNMQDSSRLEFCEITYGKATKPVLGVESQHGGALLFWHSSKVRINHCRIAYNWTADRTAPNGQNGATSYSPGIPGGPGTSGRDASTGNGGAIFCYYSAPLFTDCELANNRTGHATGGQGGNGGSHSSYYGGVFNLYGGDGAKGGDAASGRGGAVCLYNSSPEFINCRFYGNVTGKAQAGDGGYGGGADCVFAPNNYSAGGDGADGGHAQSGKGGAVFGTASNATFRNCLFYNNWIGSAQAGSGGNGGYAWAMGAEGMAYGGDGGDGGSGVSGEGIALYFDLLSGGTIQNCTFADHRDGFSSPGMGGGGGGFFYQGAAGQPGSNGTNEDTDFLLFGNSPQMVNCVVAGNAEPSLGFNQTTSFVRYCCLQEFQTGLGNFIADPLFAEVPLGAYFLSQTAAGQPQQSPCVDAGCPDSALIPGTTRTDGLPDAAIVDVGFHYSAYTTQPYVNIVPADLNFFSGIGSDPPPQEFIISNFGVGQFVYSVVQWPEWVSVSPVTGGPVPPQDTVTVAVNIAGMACGTYEDDIIVVAEGAAGSPAHLTVNLTIHGAILNVQSNLTINALAGGPLLLHRPLSIRNLGSSALQWSLQENIDWLTAEPLSGQTLDSSVVDLAIDISGMPNGTYGGELIISGELAAFSPDTVQVVLNIADEFILTGPLSGVLPGYTSYTVVGGIEVEQGDTLVIEPGATLCFEDYNENLKVYGCLIAVGIESDSIRFCSRNNQANISSIGILSSGTSNLSYCQIDSAHQTGLYYGSLLSSYIQNSTIRNCGYSGIRLEDQIGLVTIADCHIAENEQSSSYGAGINCDGSAITVTDCIIESNNSEGHGGGVYIYDSPGAVFSNCIFQNNLAQYGGGGILVDGSDGVIIEHCTFVGNQASGGGALAVQYSNDVTIAYCLMHGNRVEYSGGAFYGYHDENTLYDHCTVSADSADSIGGAAYFYESVAPTISNSIFANCIGEGAFGGLTQDVNITYSDFYANQGDLFSGSAPPGLGTLSGINANSDSCDAYHNIFLNPLFFASSGDSAFRLTAESPCIDAGDPNSRPDPDSTIADIGKYYLASELAVLPSPENPVPTSFCLMPAFPNPFNAQIAIRYGLPIGSMVRLTIYNLIGQEVAVVIDGWRLPGWHEVTFEDTHLASGIYIYRLEAKPSLAGQAGDFTASGKMVLMK